MGTYPSSHDKGGNILLICNYGKQWKFYFPVWICDSYKVWKYLASYFENIVLVNSNESNLLYSIAEKTEYFSYENKKWLQVTWVFVTINDRDINLCNCLCFLCNVIQ